MTRYMADLNALNAAFREDPKAGRSDGTASRRELRAMRTRAQALSPLRILSQVLLVPVVTIAMTVSIYTRISPYERTDALRHLAALAGCDTAASMGLAPAFEGGLGYHVRNDPDGNGIACESAAFAARPAAPVPPAATRAPVSDERANVRGGAKFIRP